MNIQSNHCKTSSSLSMMQHIAVVRLSDKVTYCCANVCGVRAGHQSKQLYESTTKSVHDGAQFHGSVKSKLRADVICVGIVATNGNFELRPLFLSSFTGGEITSSVKKLFVLFVFFSEYRKKNDRDFQDLFSFGGKLKLSTLCNVRDF